MPNPVQDGHRCGHCIQLKFNRTIFIFFGPLFTIPISRFIVGTVRGHVSSSNTLHFSAFVRFRHVASVLMNKPSGSSALLMRWYNVRFRSIVEIC